MSIIWINEFKLWESIKQYNSNKLAPDKSHKLQQYNIIQKGENLRRAIEKGRASNSSIINSTHN